MPLRVLHLVGSAVSDFHCELSLVYARDCLEATRDPAAYDVHLAYVTPDRRWRFPADLGPDALAAAAPVPVHEALGRLVSLDLDLMVPQMFCRPGMTEYRALFDLLGVPYLGNPAEVMALSVDKAKARAVVSAAGVRVPPGEVLRRGDVPSLAPPVVVKPVDADNSLGISLVRDPSEYDAATDLAHAHADAALVEAYVDLGREVRCGVLVRDGELVCLPLEEYRVDPVHKPIRGYADKLAHAAGGAVTLVAKDPTRAWIVDPDDPVTAPVSEAARRCHVALGCRHYSLFDFRIDPGGIPWFLEAGLYCSFARTSVVAVMARAAGIAVDELFRSTVDQCLARVPNPS